MHAGRILALAAFVSTLPAGRAGAAPFAYVSAGTDLKAIDTVTDTVAATIPVGEAAGGILVTPDGSRVYMTGGAARLKVIDTATNAVTDGGVFSAGPVSLNPSGTRLYVLDGTTVRVVDTSTFAIVASISIGGTGGFTMAMNPSGSRLYVPGGNFGFVAVVDTGTNTVIASIGGVGAVSQLAITPGGATLYAAGGSGTPISVIDTVTNTVTTTIPISGGSSGLAVNPAGTRLYSPQGGSIGMYVVDTTTNSVVTNVPLSGGCIGNPARDVAVNPTGTKVYFRDLNTGCVGVLDTSTNTVSATLPMTAPSGGWTGSGLFVGPFCPNACSDGNVCTTDSCDAIGGCGHAFNTFPCASDGNQCTDDVCDGAGSCSHPSSAIGTTCSDGVFCNGTDTCDGAGGCNDHTGDPCAGGPECAQTCNEVADNCFDSAATACITDNNVCTEDHCDGTGACIHTANTASCDDGLFCDGTDTCAGGTCHHTGDPCTGGGECANACNEAADNCFETPGTPCTADANVCTLDQCDGAGACTHPPGNTGTVCRSAAGSCDVAETCTGTSATCPADGFQPDGTGCSDANACTSGETCTAGVCGGGSAVVCPLCQTCDTVDGCVVGPRTGCKHPLAAKKASVVIQDRTPDDTDQVKWAWSDGQATTFGQLGAPLTTDDYALCVYDGGSNLVVSFPAPAGGTCGTKPCWKQIGPSTAPTGYKYKDATRAQNGLDTLVLKSGIDTKAKMTFKAKGPNVPMPSLGFALPLTVQLQGEGGGCWESAFPSSGVTLSTPTDFKAKGQ